MHWCKGLVEASRLVSIAWTPTANSICNLVICGDAKFGLLNLQVARCLQCLTSTRQRSARWAQRDQCGWVTRFWKPQTEAASSQGARGLLEVVSLTTFCQSRSSKRISYKTPRRSGSDNTWNILKCLRAHECTRDPRWKNNQSFWQPPYTFGEGDLCGLDMVWWLVIGGSCSTGLFPGQVHQSCLQRELIKKMRQQWHWRCMTLPIRVVQGNNQLDFDWEQLFSSNKSKRRVGCIHDGVIEILQQWLRDFDPRISSRTCH